MTGEIGNETERLSTRLNSTHGILFDSFVCMCVCVVVVFRRREVGFVLVDAGYVTASRPARVYILILLFQSELGPAASYLCMRKPRQKRQNVI